MDNLANLKIGDKIQTMQLMSQGDLMTLEVCAVGTFSGGRLVTAKVSYHKLYLGKVTLRQSNNQTIATWS